MPNPSTAVAKSSSSRGSVSTKAPLLDSRRLSELIGFLLVVAGLLVLLSLVSYRPRDPSFNTVGEGPNAANWVGLVGSYSADVLFQALGWVAYLLPLALFVVGVRLLLVRPFEAPRSKAIGFALLAGSLAALLELFPYNPPIRGLIRGRACWGTSRRQHWYAHLTVSVRLSWQRLFS
jgi:hypothetical protein